MGDIDSVLQKIEKVMTRPLRPQSEKLIPYIPASDYTVIAIGLRNPYARSESGAGLVLV